MTPFDPATGYDPHDLKRPRKKRVSKFTHKETALNEETELQIACIKHYDSRCRIDAHLRENTRIFAVSPNDGYRAPHQRALAKRMGQRAGVWDLHFFDRRTGKLIYTWIELKAINGRLSDDQEKWAQFFYGTPVKFCEVRSLNEFMVVIA